MWTCVDHRCIPNTRDRLGDGVGMLKAIMSSRDKVNFSQPEIRSRKVRTLRRRDGLIKFAHDVTSQNGEDGVLARIFKLCELPTRSLGYCVDVGAWDGKHLSNTYSLLWTGKDTRIANARHQCGSAIVDNNSREPLESVWTGVLIEADEERFNDLSNLYESKSGTVCISAAVSVEGDMWNNPRSIVSLLRNRASSLPGNFDFLCVDIDGSDYWVWHDLLEAYRPKVVCIEFNPTMGNDIVYIPPRSDSIRHGASLAALCELAERYSYVLVETTLFNAFFTTSEVYETYLTKEVPDASIEALHETSMGTSMYQLYDGTIKIAGCKRMLWHRLPLDEEKMQMIPREAREFPFSPGVEVFDMSQVIDMSPYFQSSTSEEKQLCSCEMLRELKSTGFCYVRGTSLSQEGSRAALASTHAFLEDADESVRRSCLAIDRARRGYSPMNTENFASLIGEQRPNDLVRKFRVGTESGEQNNEYSALNQRNKWPDECTWEGGRTFRSDIEGYFLDICSVADTIVQAICDGILESNPSLKEPLQPMMNDDSSKSREATSILTLLSYRPGSRHRGKSKGPLVAAHTDVGVITILLFENHPNSCAKLQRSDGNGGWLDVTLPSTVPSDPVFVVNVADCFSELCHRNISSTLHRVVPCRSSTKPRSCLALFVGLDSRTELQMPTGTITYEEWRKRRIEKSQAILQASSTEPNR